MGEIQSTQEKLYITFQSQNDIIRFVDICCKYDDAIDVKADKMSTDAKSVLGMLLVKLDEPLEIEYGCYDEEDDYPRFRDEIMRQFDVRAISVKEMKIY